MGGLLVLGHGAGGGTGAPDLQTVAGAATQHGWRVALVGQPWRVAGRRVAVAPPRLDRAWDAVVRTLETSGPLVLGGRSAGARVACRTAADLGAAAVLALAFPLHPPDRPDRSRASEALRAEALLVVQGTRDPFGGPAEIAAAVPGADVHAVAGADHAFRVRRSDGRSREQVLAEVGAVVANWLDQVAGVSC